MRMPTEPPTLMRLLTPQFDATSVVPGLAVVALIAYLLGVRALRRRGSRWPWHRTVNFVAGIVTVLLVTATQVMGYGMVLFSIHMLQKMVLTVVSAMLLMLGAPVSLAIRALPRHGWGALSRRLLLRALRCKVARVLAHPVVTTVIFVGSLYGIYFTPTFDFLMRSWWGTSRCSSSSWAPACWHSAERSRSVRGHTVPPLPYASRSWDCPARCTHFSRWRS